YNGMLLSLKHRFTNSYTISTNYTWSHCLSEGDSALNSAGAAHIWYNRHAEYGNCQSDRAQAFNLSLVAKTPTFSNRVMQRIVGNWQESTIFTAASGTPFTVLQGTDNSRTGGGDLPNVIGPAKLDNPTVQQWFNVKAFQALTCATGATGGDCGVFGNEGRNQLRGPGAWNADIALSRSFPILERQRIDFRAEIFN